MAAYHSGQETAVNILTGLGECFSVSHAVLLSVNQCKHSFTLLLCFATFSVHLSDCECLHNWNSPSYLRDNRQGERGEPDKGGNGNLSIFFF